MAQLRQAQPDSLIIELGYPALLGDYDEVAQLLVTLLNLLIIKRIVIETTKKPVVPG
jgi:hypothetical protein